MHSTAGGLGLLILAGVMNASFALPMKFVRGWAWENTWLVWSLFALLVLPGAVAALTVPRLGEIYAHNGGVIAWVAFLGAAWGVAQVLFGLALDRIGIALTFSIVLGLSAAMGSLIPLLKLHYDQIFTRPGVMSLAGVGLVLAGVGVSAVAGRMRERNRDPNASSHAHFGTGLLMATASGVCASMMNVGFAYGAPLAHAATQDGASVLWTANAVWVPLLAGGALPNVLYCAYLLVGKRTGPKYTEQKTFDNWVLAFAMAVLWFGSSVLYGAATVFLGDLGPVVGWPVFMSLIVIVASVLGVLTGEWRQAGSKALRIQAGAVAILVVAVVVLSRATF